MKIECTHPGTHEEYDGIKTVIRCSECGKHLETRFDHGGAREHAGRKPLSPRKHGVKLQVYLSAEARKQLKELQRFHKMGRSEVLTLLIEDRFK